LNSPRDCLGHVSGGRILDVATGNGGFIGFLVTGLKDYSDIVAIDTSERAGAAFAETFKDQPQIRFERMDAGQMAYADASFDTVCIANSLHHMPDLKATLSEMKRVLRPGGHFIVLEMYRDGLAETQLTHVQLHHWWAAVDRAQGVVHNETYTRQEIADIVAGLGLQDVSTHDLSDMEGDPQDAEASKQLGEIIDRYVQRAAGHPDLQRRGEALRRRIQEVGFHAAASLLVVGRKAPA